MIVTRQRRRRLDLRRLVLPILALAALAVAFAWSPSREAIANGPLKPILGSLVRPFDAAVLRQTIADRDRTIRDLNAQLEQQRAAKADDDAKVQQLQQQLDALARQPRPTPYPAVRPTAVPADLTAQAPRADADKALAATWAAMDPDRVAALAQRLPDDDVTRVIAVMDTDSAAQILNALPARVAARISRAVAQVQPSSNR